jgi:2-oxoglutarate dehydrogenase E2 component (dihydrolipoamide succinyltransferase)
MATAVFMPELGEGVDEATITQWLIKVGEEVREFDPLVEVNTDKVDTEIPSPASGTVLRILAMPDQVVQAGETLAWIGDPGENVTDDTSDDRKVVPGKTEEAVAVAAEPAVRSVRPAGSSEMIRPGRHPEFGYISPVVARIVAEHNLDLSAVVGTGKDGRITKGDVLDFVESHPVNQSAPALAADPVPDSSHSAEIPGDILKLSTMRKMIADHMVMSKETSPHVTTVMEADMSKVVAHRAVNKPVFARDSVKLTYTAYFISAIASALRRFPIVNSSWGDDGIHLHRAVNVGMATALEADGLIVPVIKAADELSLLGVARKINDLAHRARQKQLKPDEVRDGTFTLTNHGTSGSLFATPIINQPQCGILGVGLMQKRVVVINDAIAIRPMVYISLTFDHRILDGATADYFLAAIKVKLENWT